MSNNFDDAINNSFTVTLVSSASMNIFSKNSLTNFKNLLNEEINLQGEWKVALTKITIPTHINIVTDTKLIYYKKHKVKASQKVNKNNISRPYDGERVEILRGLYDDVKKIINEINLKTELENISYDIDPITRHLTLWMHYWERITFGSPQILSILGFKCIRDGTGYHIGYKRSSQVHIILTTQNLISDYPDDMTAGTQLMFIY